MSTNWRDTRAARRRQENNQAGRLVARDLIPVQAGRASARLAFARLGHHACRKHHHVAPLTFYEALGARLGLVLLFADHRALVAFQTP
jgi:hypothetical protein